ncbi:unnamed protein product, partial [Discosporangium mesarthrocarpum]
QAARDAGVKQFVFISVHNYRVPSFVKRIGYFEGKRRTEKLVGELFGSKGYILRPGLIYGERGLKLRGPDGQDREVSLPLQRVGEPLERITSMTLAKRIAGSGLPLADVFWTQPLSAEKVALAAVKCCLGTLGGGEAGSGDAGGAGGGLGVMENEAIVLTVEDMAVMA